MDHGSNKYKCVVCDREFETIAQLNAHGASHGSDIGACSPFQTPSKARYMMLWDQLRYRHKPWHSDVRQILGSGKLQEESNKHYRQIHARVPVNMH